MARIKLGGLITDIRGSVNGSTFQGSQGGLVLKNKGIPRKSKTQRQVQFHANLNTLQQLWQGYPVGAKTEWDVYAQFLAKQQANGNGRLLNGQAVFIRINSYRILLGLAIQEKPEYIQGNFNWGVPEVKNIVTDFKITTLLDFDLSLVRPYVKMSGAVGVQRNAKASSLKFILPGASTGDGYSLQSGYVAAYGAVPESGKFVYVELITVFVAFRYPITSFAGWLQVGH